MVIRPSKFDLGKSTFSAADREHASYLFRNPRTLLTGDWQGGFNPLAPARSPGIDHAILLWNDARENDDRAGMQHAAERIVAETAGVFRMQGVPVFAHPVLAPQFVTAEAERIKSQPASAHTALLNDILDKFDHSAKPGASRQFVAQLSNGSKGRGVAASPSIAGLTDQADDRASQSAPMQAQNRRDQPLGIQHTQVQVDERGRNPVCASLQSEISSHRGLRGLLITEHGQLRAKLQAARRKYFADASHLRDLEDQLRRAQAELKVHENRIDNFLPPTPIRRGRMDVLREDIRNLGIQIQELRADVSREADEIHEIMSGLENAEAKLRETEIFLIEPERKYEQECGRLDPWLGSWRDKPWRY